MIETSQAEDANMAIIDIVGYPELPGLERVGAVWKLTKIVRDSQTLSETADNPVFFLPTGDGMVVGVLGLPERRLELAREIHQRTPAGPIREPIAAAPHSLVGQTIGKTKSWNEILVISTCAVFGINET